MGPTNLRAKGAASALIVLVILGCIGGVVAACAAAGFYYYRNIRSSLPGIPVGSGGQVTPEPTVTLNRPGGNAIPKGTETALDNTAIPPGDLYSLACRLKDVCNVPHVLPGPVTPLQIGDTQKFWVGNTNSSSNFQVTATLRYITPHSYFWVEAGVSAKDSDIKALMDTFENKIYPTDREFFGSEWTPGVDNDLHIYVLYVRGVGSSVGGYFSLHDEVNPAVYKYSNGHELFIFNADGESLTDEYTYGTLAHEFQHMIRYNQDRNETSWLNEGFSEVAMLLNGYGVGGFDDAYAEQPDLPLTEWPSLATDPGLSAAHYGQAFLFLTYFLDRFGPQVTQAVGRDQLSSLESLDDTLRTLRVTDQLTGKPVTADDVILDWMATMYLQDGSVGDGRYAYHNYPTAPKVSATRQIDTCPQQPVTASVNQYGAQYIQIRCVGDYRLSFKGSTVTKILPTDAHSGKFMWWSNKADESDMTLTRGFDFSGVSGPIDFSYWAWYDLEKGYDYAYLEASADGQHWDILKTTSCTTQDRSGNAYGCGYNAKSGGGAQAIWLQEHADLSGYAGKNVQLRFEYVTDPAVTGVGLLLDDMSIPAVNYSSDFEADGGGWQADGFVRIDNALPQTFRLSLILQGSQTTVEDVPVSADQTADVPLALRSGETAVLIVTATQRDAHIPAGYTLEVK